MYKCIINIYTIFPDSLALGALECRQGDKQARDFIKKLKNKSYS